ncbi:MAG: aminotransferase class I/II-fold pyridoxal phosphate-dependent enzyme [Anaerohalosphaeraceae bacterium]|nr:aminotransferase class I/II-fold pyridoxal phosphate-dependent enzyme [Anaerohalosphaeraceae bacterium]
MKNYIADRTSLVDASGIRRIFNLAASMKDPVNLSIGLPDFDVPDALKQVAIGAIEQGQNRYSVTSGSPELGRKISEKIRSDIGWSDPSVLVTSGVSGGLVLAFMALINPGDEVIIPDPYFVMYKHLVNLFGGKCVFVDSYPDFALPVEKIANAITDKTKLIILNSPSNPTGVVYSSEQIEAVVKIAAEKEILIISDEIYDKFCYDGPCPSVAKQYDKTLLLSGFSKSHAMTGWRLGYAAAGESLKPVIEEMTKLQQYTFVCAPTPLQQAAITAVDYDVSSHIADYKVKRDMVYNGLKDKFEIAKPGGAFYMFIKAPGGSGTEFVERAIRKNLLIIPGGVFSEKDTHFRICYTTGNDKLAEAIEILRSLA